MRRGNLTYAQALPGNEDSQIIVGLRELSPTYTLTPMSLPDTHTIHLWQVALSQPPAVIKQLSHLLVADEMTRAQRFMRESDQHAFIIARATLRAILARYLNQSPQTITFKHTATGKPYVADHALQFNMSHSRELAMIAIGNRQKLGVDVEYEKRDMDITAIIKRYYSTNEQRALLNMPLSQKCRAFVQCWTVKEAIVKASGDGLAVALAKIDTIDCLSKDHFAIQDHNNKEWLVNSWQPTQHYYAALVSGKHNNYLKKYKVLFTN